MKESFKQNVASELKALRAKRGLKQKEVAEIAGIDTMTIVRYENNSTSMQLDMIENVFRQVHHVIHLKNLYLD